MLYGKVQRGKVILCLSCYASYLNGESHLLKSLEKPARNLEVNCPHALPNKVRQKTISLLFPNKEMICELLACGILKYPILKIFLKKISKKAVCFFSDTFSV